MMGAQVFNSDSAATLFAACVITCLAGCTSQPSDLSVAGHQRDVAVSTPLRLDHVTVVDTLTGVATPDMSILMQRGRISAIEPTAAVTGNASIHTLNARGKFVVPGYNDMHTHALTAPNATAVLALLLADGVTGVRQMDGSPELLAARAARTLPLSNDTPALLVAPGNLILPFDATSVDGARVEVRQQKQQGADFIKIASTTPPVFLAAVGEASRVGLPAVGHVQGGEPGRRGASWHAFYRAFGAWQRSMDWLFDSGGNPARRSRRKSAATSCAVQNSGIRTEVVGRDNQQNAR